MGAEETQTNEINRNFAYTLDGRNKTMCSPNLLCFPSAFLAGLYFPWCYLLNPEEASKNPHA
jgi:hypothetical protein